MDNHSGAHIVQCGRGTDECKAQEMIAALNRKAIIASLTEKKMNGINNRQTLEHYLGQVWLTRVYPFAGAGDLPRGVNVCVESGEEFVAIDYLLLAPDGVYYSKGTAIGKREDNTFRRYIEKLAGVNGMSEAALFQRVCDCYTASGDILGVAQALGLSKGRVRRILITQGMLTSDLIEKIAWLYDGGKGLPVSEIAKMLKVSENTVHKNMAY